MNVTAQTVIERYFRALEGGDVQGAAACFAEDAVYSHPAYLAPDGTTTGGRLDVRGRRAIEDLLTERGNRPVTHVLTSVASANDVLFVEGVVHDDGGTVYASFVSVGRLDAVGLIEHYSAYTAVPVPGAAVGAPLATGG